MTPNKTSMGSGLLNKPCNPCGACCAAGVAADVVADAVAGAAASAKKPMNPFKCII
jgi:hypothetical protein